MTDIALLHRARAPHRHRRPALIGADGVIRYTCGHEVDPAKAKRGRTNRSRGNRIELEVARQLGLRKVGMYGGPEDAGDRDSPFLVQVKSRKAWPSWMDDELAKLPVTAQQTPLLVVAEAGTPGRKRRALVVLRIEDWVALHGGEVA